MATKKSTKKKTSARKATAKKAATKKATTKPPAKKSVKTDGKPKKLSAIDAAAKVLAESKQPMSARQMIDAMAAKKYWTSPGGKTPWATLYSAILRSINKEGKESRFEKAGRGKFTLNG